MSRVNIVIDDDSPIQDDYRDHLPRYSQEEHDEMIREFRRMVTERAQDIQKRTIGISGKVLSFDPNNLDVDGATK